MILLYLVRRNARSSHRFSSLREASGEVRLDCPEGAGKTASHGPRNRPPFPQNRPRTRQFGAIHGPCRATFYTCIELSEPIPPERCPKADTACANSASTARNR